MDSRRRIFWSLLPLVPVLLLLTAEAGLRASGYSTGYPLFLPLENRPEFAAANPEVGRRYFSGPSPPTILADYFRIEPPDSSLRIVVQGGSTAAGFPYYYGGTFPHILEARLQASMPGRHVQVINTGMAAVNTWTLLDLSDEILALKPDAVLVYAGHNEYYGALGIGSTERLPLGPNLISGYLQVQRLRLVQLLKDGLRKLGSRRPLDASRMEHLVAKQSISLGSSDFRSGVEQFRSNLSRLVQRYVDAGIPVFVGTLVSNERDHPPFVSRLQSSTDTARWGRLTAAARQAFRSGRWTEAVSAYRELAHLDSLSAAAHFGLAKSLEHAGDVHASGAAYLRAKELDELRFRAPEAMNDVIRKMARHPGVHLVDVQASFREAAPNGVIGRRLMADHLHPTPEGFFLMADAFYEALIRSDVVDAHPARYVDRSSARDHHLLTRVDSMVGAYHIAALTQEWPFTMAASADGHSDRIAAASHSEPAMMPDDPVGHLAYRLYRREIGWSEANARLIAYYEHAGVEDAALRAARSRKQELPHLYEPHLTAARYFARGGRFDDAARSLQDALALEDRPDGHLMLAQVLRRMGKNVEAVEHMRRAAALRR